MRCTMSCKEHETCKELEIELLNIRYPSVQCVLTVLRPHVCCAVLVYKLYNVCLLHNHIHDYAL